MSTFHAYVDAAHFHEALGKGLYEKLYHIQQESLDWVV